MKYSEIDRLYGLLAPLKLNVVNSLSRRRLLKLLKAETEIVSDEIREKRIKYSLKNPDGSEKIVDNEYQFTKEDRKLFDEEIKDLLDQKSRIDFSGNMEDLKNCTVYLQEQIDKTVADKKDGMNSKEFEYVAMLQEWIEKLSNIK